MPWGFYNTRDSRPQAARPQRTSVRKVVDPKGNKYLVRDVFHAERYVRQEERRQYQAYAQPQYPQRNDGPAGNHAERVVQHDHGRQSEAHARPQYQPYREARKAYKSEAGNYVQQEAYDQPQQRRSAPDPYLAAEKARRQAKKQKYLKWLMFFIL